MELIGFCDMKGRKEKLEFGDFQTPVELASKMLSILKEMQVLPSTIVEPTCGTGTILKLCLSNFFPEKVLGVEINKAYTEKLKIEIQNDKVEIINADIFEYVQKMKSNIDNSKSILFIGNPPWITSSKSSAIGANNLPKKNNINKLAGIEAITGKSNFDISEYILKSLIEAFYHMKSVFAFLCKTIVVRNILKWMWQKNIEYKEGRVYPIDTKRYFNACCDASFFVLDFREKVDNKSCKLYDNIEDRTEINAYSCIENYVSCNISFLKKQNYFGKSDYTWRSGIKHDCTKVFELTVNKSSGKIFLINGFGETLDVEPHFIFPLLKSSDLVRGRQVIRKNIIVPQRKIGDDTSIIKNLCPKTWDYLGKYKTVLANRKSIVYKNKPLFSIFSIGDYSFKPYKVGISALYKSLNFCFLSMENDKPIMLDDTCNFLSFDDEKEAIFIYRILTSELVKNFLNALIFWQSKRPVTIEVLNMLDLRKVAIELGLGKEYDEFNYKKMNQKGIQLELL